MGRFFIGTAFAVGGLLVLGVGPAMAAPGQALGGWGQSPDLLIQVDSTTRQIRRLERKGFTVIPPVPPIVVREPAMVAPAAERPTSCGEYHFWDGTQCLDARYHDPDLSPTP